MPDNLRPWLRIVAAPHPSRLPLDALQQDCELTMTRRSGPGGQHRNKTSTAVVLRHRPTDTIAEASESRSQAENRANAVQRLRLVMAVALRCQTRDGESQNREGESRARDGESRADDEVLRSKHRGRSIWVSEHNARRPAVISLVLDDALEAEGDLQVVAERWQTTSSQLLKLLRSHTPALDYLNRLRGSYDLRPLR